MAFYQLYREQKINTSLEEMWDFISSPGRLKEITPDYMRFDITSKHIPKKMYEGMIISYKISPLLSIKIDWVAEITHIREKEFFIDEQRIGPYSFWHHQHILKPIKRGTLMKDIVTYAPPYGLLGVIANTLVIRNKLKKIFDYRKKEIEKRYGTYK